MSHVNQVKRSRLRYVAMAGILIVVYTVAMAQKEAGLLVGTKTLQVDLTRPDGFTSSSCAVVTRDGQYHIEHRIQRVNDHTLTNTVAEGRMSNEQFSVLMRRLSSPEVQLLPEWHDPASPGMNDKLDALELDIHQGASKKRSGYLIWSGTSPELRMDSSALQSAEESKKVLDPIAHQIDDLHGRVLTGADTPSLRCE
jgi:hypothetical protein